LAQVVRAEFVCLPGLKNAMPKKGPKAIKTSAKKKTSREGLAEKGSRR